MKRRIVLLGPPASGKGTQAEMLKDRYGLPSASPGAMLRDEKKAGTALGIEADRLTSSGRLVSDEVINRVVSAWIGRQEGDGFVFDGYPRTLGQAEALDQVLGSRGTPLEAAVLLEVDFATLRSRVEARMVCHACGNIVSVGSQVAAGGSCPRCGGELVRRSDDSAATFEIRLQEYMEKTAPVAGYYGKRALLRRVEGTRPPDEVFADVCRILNAQ